MKHGGIPELDDFEALSIDIEPDPEIEKAEEAERKLPETLGKDFETEDKAAKCKRVYSRHTMFRVISEINLEKVLPWHFNPGDCYHCFSWGDVDTLTYFRYVVKQQHIKYAFFATWVMAMEDCEEVESWLEAGYIDRCDFFVGEIFKNSYYQQYEKLCSICRKYGGRVCVFRNHSKVMALFGDRFNVVIEASANINHNPRSEQATITVDDELAYWYKDIFDDIQSFQRDFDHIKPWEG